MSAQSRTRRTAGVLSAPQSPDCRSRTTVSRHRCIHHFRVCRVDEGTFREDCSMSAWFPSMAGSLGMVSGAPGLLLQALRYPLLETQQPG